MDGEAPAEMDGAADMEGMDGEMDGEMDDREGDADAPVVGIDGEAAALSEEEKASNAGDIDFSKDPSKCLKFWLWRRCR